MRVVQGDSEEMEGLDYRSREYVEEMFDEWTGF